MAIGTLLGNSSMTTDQVKAWQTTLKNSGYDPGKVDGIWGPNTQAAYNAYNSASNSTYIPGTIQTEAVKNTDILNNIPGYKYTSDTGLPDMPNIDIGGAYDTAAETYKQYIDAAKASNQANYQYQQGALGKQYDTARGQAYVNSRLGAIGNNEALAARGLAGNLYGGARSGESEMSRVMQNVAMRNTMNAATQQENTALDKLAFEIMQSGLALDMDYAKYMAQSIIDKAHAQQEAEQQRMNNSWQYYQRANELQSPATYSGGGYDGGSGGEYSAGYTAPEKSSGGSSSSGGSKSSTITAQKSAPSAGLWNNYSEAIYDMYSKYGIDATKAAVSKDYANGGITKDEHAKAKAFIDALEGSKLTVLPY